MAPRAPTEYRELLHGLLQGSYTDITFHDVFLGSRLPLLFRLFQRRFCSVYMPFASIVRRRMTGKRADPYVNEASQLVDRPPHVGVVAEHAVADGILPLPWDSKRRRLASDLIRSALLLYNVLHIGNPNTLWEPPSLVNPKHASMLVKKY